MNEIRTDAAIRCIAQEYTTSLISVDPGRGPGGVCEHDVFQPGNECIAAVAAVAANATTTNGADVTPVSCSVAAPLLPNPYCGTSDGKCGTDHVIYGVFVLFILVQLTLVFAYWMYFWFASGEFDTTR